jgi:hypothetical protein
MSPKNDTKKSSKSTTAKNRNPADSRPRNERR